ncbi:MAG: hypothetical protein LPK92_03115, partial [Actinomycetes bacterium]|nr:hypothetical protein [Actinomycetes bacterium]
ALKGYLLRLTTGDGAGQVRRIWNNTATMIEVEGEWDVAPTLGDAFVVTGYTAPVVTTELVGTVTAISGDFRTVTLTGVTLPADTGGLSGALLRLVGANGTATYRTIAFHDPLAGTVTVVDPWGSDTFTLGVSEVYVAEVPGAVVERVTVLVHDGDTPGVVITPVGGDIRLVEGAVAGQFGHEGTYTVRLTQSPGAETVTVLLTAIQSHTLSETGTCGLPDGCYERQLEFWDGTDWVDELALVFTAANWMTPVEVTIRAIDDLFIDGTLVQEFADAARRLHLIQGPLYVSGGDDPNPPVQLELDDYLPIVLPGESSGHPLPVTASTAGAIETAQVDTLVVHNED